MSRDLFDGNIVRDLNQQIRVTLQDLAITDSLSWECLLRPLLLKEVDALREFKLNQVDNVFEPFAEQYSILPAAWLAKIGIR